MKTVSIFVSTVFLAAIVCIVSAQAQPQPLGHFRFDGNAKNEVKSSEKFELRNTVFRDNALYLNGKYNFQGPADAYAASFRTEDLDYQAFAVALRFKADYFEHPSTNLLTGGSSHRWFGMGRSGKGNLLITLNNGAFKFEVNGAVLEPKVWTVVAFSLDVSARKFLVFINGRMAAEGELPTDFDMPVSKLDAKYSDKAWLFTDYSNARVFHGLVDELIIYGHSLTADEMRNIPLGSRN